MIKFKFFKYPVEIDFSFLFLLIIFGHGYLRAEMFPQFLELSLILFLSIFIHELGHALMFSKYKVNSRIELYGMGGLCYPDRNVSHKANIFVSLAGPFAGFAIAGIYWVIMKYSPMPAWNLSVGERTNIVYFVTLGYGVLNLLPIYPLDGGHAFKSFLHVLKMRCGRCGHGVLPAVYYAGSCSMAGK
jgi:Zn-dependent protease